MTQPRLSPGKRKSFEGGGTGTMKQTTLNFGQGPGGKSSKVGAVGVTGRGLAGPQAASTGGTETRVTRSRSAPPPPPRKSERLGTAKAAAGPVSKAAKKPVLAGAKQKACGPTKHSAGKGAKVDSSRPVAKGARARFLEKVDRGDGEVLRVGDDVYVVLDESCLGLSDEEEEDYCCLVCGAADKESEAMLECGKCLGGWHLSCLVPPLDDVPEGDWLCPDCAAGKPAPPRPAKCSRERFLQQQGLGLARVEALWEEAGGEQQCTIRWFSLPEETHTGRQSHHLAREVFLTQHRQSVGVDTLGRCAHVLPYDAFTRGSGDARGDDVFCCEYNYDTAWQRFTRRTQFDSEGEDDWCPSSDEEPEPEDRDRVGKPIAAYHTEEGLVQPKSMRGGGGGINRRRKTQGGEQLLGQVGALEIPDHVRGRRTAGGAASALAQARDMLTLTAVPASLPCREKEREQVEQFVREVLDDADSAGCGKCLYVSGIPGTGKTATVLEVMRGLKRRAEEGEVPHFQFVEVNGLRLPSPLHAYSTLYEALTGNRVGPQAAAQLLDDMMRGGGAGGKSAGARRHTIVLVDEMDLLINKTQTVLYNLFDWPGHKGSRLSIIGIANTMDLPERLHPRIGSRLAGRRLVFHPYNPEQLERIITSRLEGLAAFDPRAVKLVSQKVANCSGDVRRCLELCRRATEIAEERWQQQQQQQQQGAVSSDGAGASSDGSVSSMPQQKPESGRVEMKHVNAAVQEMFNTSHALMVRTASRLERLLLAALHMETRFSGRADAMLEDVAERLRALCINNQEQQYEFGAVLESAVRLGSKRLILCDPGHKRLKMKMTLNVPTNDLLHVLKNDDQISWLASRLTAA